MKSPSPLVIAPRLASRAVAASWAHLLLAAVCAGVRPAWSWCLQTLSLAPAWPGPDCTPSAGVGQPRAADRFLTPTRGASLSTGRARAWTWRVSTPSASAPSAVLVKGRAGLWPPLLPWLFPAPPAHWQ